jgi:indole-3-glycerol phosphate synthase
VTGLEEIVRRKRLDLERKKKEVPLAELERAAKVAAPIRDFPAAIRRPGEVSLISELKKASPSAGLLRKSYDVAEGARAYERGGARALSVLTEENYFLGRLSHMVEAKKASGLPVLRKDFLFDPYQVFEARAHGADAVLLITALLDRASLSEMRTLVRRLGMAALVEVHDAAEMETSLAVGADMIGVNSRNLKDLTMNAAAFEEMIPLIPRDRTIVAESGIKTVEDVRRLRALGVHAVLVGESLLKQPDLERATKILSRAGGG